MLLQSRFVAFAASILLGVSTMGVTGTAFADVDPPSRVARLSYLSGNVSFAPAGESEWANASLNRPLNTGDRLWADTNSRTELQVGAAVIRIDESSGFNFLNLDDRTAQVQLTQGTLNLRVSRIYGGQVYEVDTPTLAFVVSRVGEYRFDVDPNGKVTTVSVIDGAGEVYGEQGSRYSIGDHQSVRFNDNQLHDYQTSDLPAPNAFDRFCSDRDHRQEHSVSHEFVSEEVIGASDLDDNGDWQASPEYGHVWYPSHVAADWAPYRNGHWAWVDPWGWTWVDAASWGFAPFHYGRWSYVSDRWGWIPGPVDVRPIYAPALVAFVGGNGWSVGIGGGQPVGWFPLGPREVFVPGYHVSRTYFNDVNIRNTTINNNVNITNIYNNYSNGNINVNQNNYAYHNVPNAVTAVPGNVFTGALPVAGANIRMDRANLERGQVASIAGIAPNRASLVAGGIAKNAPPAQAFDRQVIARNAPPSAIVPFSQRQATLQENAGKTAPAPRYLPAAAIAGAGGAGAAMAMRSNVRVVPQASINATATPIGRQTPSTTAVNGQPGNGQPGAPRGPAIQNNQPPARLGNTGNNVPQNANGPIRNNVNPALSNRPPLNTNAVQGNPQNNPQPTLSDRPPSARTPGSNRSNNTDVIHSPNAVQNQQNNSTAMKPQDRPPNARTSTQPRTDTSHAESVQSHVQSTGSPAATQADNNIHGRDRGAAPRNNESTQNNNVAPSRTQQNVIRAQPVQQQPCRSSNRSMAERTRASPGWLRRLLS